MSASQVYFSDLRTSFKENIFLKLDRLLDAAAMDDVVAERRLMAIKLHFGEKGNSAFIRPTFLRTIVDRVKGLGAHPFPDRCQHPLRGDPGEQCLPSPYGRTERVCLLGGEGARHYCRRDSRRFL